MAERRNSVGAGGKEFVVTRLFNATEEERKTFEEGYTSMQEGFKGTLDQLDEYLMGVTKGDSK